MSDVVYGDTARTLWEEGLQFMQLRMGWAFEEEIADAFKETFAECGLPLDKGLMSVTDNAYINTYYGFVNDLADREKERIQGLAKKGELLYYNEESGAFIEMLRIF